MALVKSPFRCHRDPRDRELVADLSKRLGRPVRPVQLNAYEIRHALARIYGLPLGEGEGRLLRIDAAGGMRFDAGQPASDVLNGLLGEAIRRRATDIHLEAYEGDADVRLRLGRVYQARIQMGQQAGQMPDDGVFQSAADAFARAAALSEKGGDLEGRIMAEFERARVLAAWPGHTPDAKTAYLQLIDLAGSEGGNRAADSGVGLGLALVDEHVRLHGGRVWVEDRRDGESGARFVVELPVVEPAKEETSSARTDEGGTT